ncbi:MAG: HNH endonuclease [Bdellovibrionota bacterium]
MDIHHIVPRSMGGTDTVENLTTLCGQCHDLAHFPDVMAAAAG